MGWDMGMIVGVCMYYQNIILTKNVIYIAIILKQVS